MNPDFTTIAQDKAANLFPSYIDYIRFPRFRNLAANARVDFEFPITAFVGQNGCGKSSALQALFGVPKGKSVGTYWFTTALDPIEDLSPEDRHGFVYSYDGTGLEVVKRRINKKGRPDLFDTSEPIAAYGMTMGVRHPPVDKDVIYINFRAIPNAFEKAFHRERPPTPGIQDHLRMRSRVLRNALDNRFDNRFSPDSKPQEFIIREDMLRVAERILGRSYKGAKVVKHALFGEPGYSVFLETAKAKYTDAFAGSGESAVMLLLHEMSYAKKGSLLLLDEPETSLHPGAQGQLMAYLTELCIERRIQIVFCTHSPTLINDLPPSAIKVFSPEPGGAFRIVQGVSPREAFGYIGHRISDKMTIRVEDRLAQKIVQKVIDNDVVPCAHMFDMCFIPGGCDEMKKDAVVFASHGQERVVMVLDGGKKPNVTLLDPSKIPVSEFEDLTEINETFNKAIEEMTGLKMKTLCLPSDGGGHAPKLKLTQQRDVKRQFIDFYRTRVFYLPEIDPEDCIWDDETAWGLFEMFCGLDGLEEFKDELNQLTTKYKFEHLSSRICARSDGLTIDSIHLMFITKWEALRPSSYTEIQLLLESIKGLL
jgi:predicted ATPase